MQIKASYRFLRARRTAWWILFCCLLPVAGVAQSGDEPIIADEEEVEVVSGRDYDAAAAGFTDREDKYQEPVLRQVPDSTVRRLKREKAFAYADDSTLLQKRKSPEQSATFWDRLYSFLGAGFMRFVGYMLVILFFGLVIYRIIANNNLFVWRGNRKVRTTDEGMAEELEDENLEGKLQQAIAEKNYRAAVRYYYIRGLQLLSEKGWIRLHAQATNHDYIQQLSKYPVSADFRFLTQVYDYVWYGEFPVNDEQFARLQTDFQRFYQLAGS